MHEIKIDKAGCVVQILQSMNPDLKFEGDGKVIRIISKSDIIAFAIPLNWDFDRETGLLMGGIEGTFSYRLVVATK
ncbi:MAG: hypothetical protein J6K42_04200 [Clostridia bacterium]|nr:hypothetical protein [Clostridia bacterium]